MQIPAQNLFEIKVHIMSPQERPLRIPSPRPQAKDMLVCRVLSFLRSSSTKVNTFEEPLFYETDFPLWLALGFVFCLLCKAN